MQDEIGTPVLISAWISGSWTKPKTYDSFQELMNDIGVKVVGYGPAGQYHEIQGMFVGPPTLLYQKVLYVWVDDEDRMQVANSVQEAIELM